MKLKSKVLIIAGSDSSGGAGIQADIKTVTALGSYAMTAITAITAQNTKDVKKIISIPTEIVQKQMEIWTVEKIYILIEELNTIELKFKKNYELSNNLIFDLILNTSKNSNN